MNAKGTFDVTLTPAKGDEKPGGEGIGRMLLDKRYHGPLEATSVGEMLGAMTATKGSAGYVALERVTGSLGGRSGSFVLQHSGVMDRGAQELTIVVVPDSATGGLEGLRGTMRITNSGGEHSYQFEYLLPHR